MIVNYYIETAEEDRISLERLLNVHGFAFYDATHVDALTSQPEKFRTLDEIECELETK